MVLLWQQLLSYEGIVKTTSETVFKLLKQVTRQEIAFFSSYHYTEH